MKTEQEIQDPVLEERAQCAAQVLLVATGLELSEKSDLNEAQIQTCRFMVEGAVSMITRDDQRVLARAQQIAHEMAEVAKGIAKAQSN